MKIVYLFLFLSMFYTTYAQKQNNTPGSDFFIDVPTFIDIAKDSVIPVTVYVHESECTNCSNDLNYIDIRLKSYNQSNFDAPIVFDTLLYQAYMSLFSAYSLQDANWDSQSFLDSKPYNDTEHTILFTADTNWWVPEIPVVHITQHYFYFNFNIPYSVWSYYLDSDSVIDMHVYASIDNDLDEEFWFRVFVKKNAIIKLPNWYRGDTHLHAVCTQNNAENGFPLEATKVAATYLGLDWITITDHSCDFDNYGQGMAQNWQNLGNAVTTLNLLGNNFIFIRGIEASVKNSQGKVVHALVYPNPQQPFSLPYIFDGGGDLSSTNININMMLDSLRKYHGFCYAAHPFSEGDALSAIVNGSVWNLGDSLSPINGQPALSVGTVIWNDLTFHSDIYTQADSEVFKTPIMGLQNLNLSNMLTCTDTERDPWNVEKNDEPFGFFDMSESNYMHTHYRYKQNQEAYSFLLRRGLRLKNQNHAIQHWKLFLSAGSDAHGSFNYSSTDYFYGGLNGAMEENYPGALATYVYAPNGMGTQGEYVLQALKDGHCLLSEGPVVNMTLISPNDTAIVGDDIEIWNNNLSATMLHVQGYTNRYFGQPEQLIIFLYSQDTVYEYITPVVNFPWNMTLADLFQALGINSPYDKYFAVRAEWYCSKDYTLYESLIYRRTHKRFFATTNPIWFKVHFMNNIANHINNTEIRVVPNPVKNKCKIYGATENIRRVTLIDMFGNQSDLPFNHYSDYVEVDLTMKLEGIYLISVETDKTCYRTKLIIE
ncbi:MAG: hypothetical protein HPY79_00865 [Bacteroidales bacterium]|nr:hypothetical protein [Bacteroidales bacterium]